MDFSEWVRTTVNPLNVQLDDENPRIAGQGLEQSQIRRLLIEHENVVELAHKISQTGGVFPHDLMIVGSFKGATVVLEGNRRICALQLLLNPSLIPDEVKDKFPRADAELKGRINKVSALLAPDRPSADYLIAQIHAFSARKAWAPLAKYRYAYSRYDEGQSVSDIAEALGSDASEVRRFIQRYNIYKEVLKLGWNAEEMRILQGEDIAIYPFIYPFERNTIRDLIGEIFDREGKRNPKYKEGIVNRFLKQLARDSLIPQSLTGKPLLTTRGAGEKSLEEYFSSSFSELINEATRVRQDEGKPKPKSKTKAGGSGGGTPKPDAFFETFSVPNSLDQKIVRLAWEISNIKWKEFPIASAMLMRSVLEEVLREHIKRVGKLDEYKRVSQNREGLKGMIIFSATKANAVFRDGKTADQLARFQNSAVKDDLDNVVHNRFGSITKESLSAIAPYVRPIIETIIQDEWA